MSGNWYTSPAFVYVVLPIISALFVNIAKSSSQKDVSGGDAFDFFNIHYDITVTALILLVTSIPQRLYNAFTTKDASAIAALLPYSFYLFGFGAYLLVVSMYIRKFGWNELGELRHFRGIVLPDILSLIVLFLIMLLMR